MARTPEGVVKDEVKAALLQAGVVPFVDVVTGKAKNYTGMYFMPVAGMFSVLGIHDFVGVWHGRFFSLETKAPKTAEDETYHQGCFREGVTASGGIALTGVRNGALAVTRLRELISAATSRTN